MNRRILAAVLALALAVVGTVALITYVRAADERALAGVETTSVLVVTRPIAEGTPATELGGSVRLEQLPVMSVATGTVRDLADLDDRVTTTTLQPGEQVLASRFADASSLLPAGIVEVPPGDQEISILLEPQRANGGRVAAGDEVGVFISMRLKDAEGTQIGTTHATLHGVLVTQVQGAPASPEEGDEDSVETASSGRAAPSENLMITLALPARDAELVVFGMEHGTVWLSLEPEGADNDGTKVVTQGNVYGDEPISAGTVYGGADE